MPSVDFYCVALAFEPSDVPCRVARQGDIGALAQHRSHPLDPERRPSGSGPLRRRLATLGLLGALSIASVLLAGQVDARASDLGQPSTAASQPQLSISGNLDGLVYPGGRAQPLEVKLTNNSALAIRVMNLTVTLAPGSLPPGCPTSYFHITQSNISEAIPTTVPAYRSVTLPNSANAPGVRAPTIRMSDASTNQDACEGTTFSLTYTSS